MTLEELYHRACKTESDIYLHVPKLRELASRCLTVAEFGVRHGISTTALLAGQPGRLVSYDFHDCPVAEQLLAVSGKTFFTFHKEDVLKAEPIGYVDFLFSDTRHTEGQVWAELVRHGDRVQRWIAFHDSTKFGTRGTDGERGIMFAIRRWLRDRPEWFITYRIHANNGLIVLSRIPGEKRLEIS